jgi:hypothetical protein
VETLVNAPKQEERKLNLHLTGFGAKEGETEKELVHRLNTELLQGQMRLRTKVVVTTRQWLATTWASASAMGARLSAMLLKFATSEDRQAEAMAVVQKSQGSKQTCLLTNNQTLR